MEGYRNWFVFISSMLSLPSEWILELDPASHTAAVRNINENGMQDRISVEKAEADGKVLFPLQGIDEQ